MSESRKVPLGEVASIQSGTGFPVRFQGRHQGQYPFAKVGDISRLVRSGRDELLHAENYVDERDLLELRAKPIAVDSVVFAKIGEAIRQNFRAITKAPLLIDNNVVAVSPDRSVLDPRYFYHFLRSLDLYPLADSTAVPSIRTTTLARILIPIPPMDEQRGISEKFGKADILQRKRQQAVGLYDEFLRSIFVEMFGSPERNPLRWPEISLGEAITDGPRNGLYKPASCYGSGTPIVRIDAFYDGIITKRLALSDDERERFALSPGEILINRVNSLEFLGKSALVPDLVEPTVFESNMMQFGVDDDVLLPRFLVELLQSPHVKAQILHCAKHAVNQSSINQADVRSLQVFVPPIDLQHEYVARLRVSDRLKLQYNEQLADLKSVYASLAYQIFGEQS
jgi:type I restriction enzyme S subunit